MMSAVWQCANTSDHNRNTLSHEISTLLFTAASDSHIN